MQDRRVLAYLYFWKVCFTILSRRIGENMIEKLLNFWLGLIDDTWNNEEDADEKLKVMERERLKKLRRK